MGRREVGREEEKEEGGRGGARKGEEYGMEWKTEGLWEGKEIETMDINTVYKGREMQGGAEDGRVQAG